MQLLHAAVTYIGEMRHMELSSLVPSPTLRNPILGLNLVPSLEGAPVASPSLSKGA